MIPKPWSIAVVVVYQPVSKDVAGSWLRKTSVVPPPRLVEVTVSGGIPPFFLLMVVSPPSYGSQVSVV